LLLKNLTKKKPKMVMKISCSDKINKTLDEILPKATKKPKELHQAMRYAVFPGGKRIRPILVCEAARACGASVNKALKVASAIELIHCYSLVHDDLPIMDNDDFRRNRPTVHKKFGEATALLAGCALLSLAFEVLAKYPEITRRVAYAIGSLGMIGGQELDLKRGHDLKLINQLKTGELFRVSLEAGALVANAGEKKLKALSNFGVKLGELFQLTDDLLDNDGFVKQLGREKTKTRSAKVAEAAKKELKIFGAQAKTLENMIDKVLIRRK